MELAEDMITSDTHFESEAKKQEYIAAKTYKYVKQQLQNFVFGLNVPSRR